MCENEYLPTNISRLELYKKHRAARQRGVRHE